MPDGSVEPATRMSLAWMIYSSPTFVPGSMMLLVTLGVFAVVLVLCFHTVPPENKDLVNVLLGVLVTVFATAAGWLWGSSKSSQTKDATIAALAVPPRGAP